MRSKIKEQDYFIITGSTYIFHNWTMINKRCWIFCQCFPVDVSSQDADPSKCTTDVVASSDEIIGAVAWIHIIQFVFGMIQEKTQRKPRVPFVLFLSIIAVPFKFPWNQSTKFWSSCALRGCESQLRFYKVTEKLTQTSQNWALKGAVCYMYF